MNIPLQRLNAIVKGRRAVSADTALLFEALTRWDAQIAAPHPEHDSTPVADIEYRRGLPTSAHQPRQGLRLLPAIRWTSRAPA